MLRFHLKVKVNGTDTKRYLSNTNQYVRTVPCSFQVLFIEISSSGCFGCWWNTVCFQISCWNPPASCFFCQLRGWFLDSRLRFLELQRNSRSETKPRETHLPSSKLTWQWKFTGSNRKYIFKWWIFHSYVSLPEGMRPFIGLPCHSIYHHLPLQELMVESTWSSRDGAWKKHGEFPMHERKKHDWVVVSNIFYFHPYLGDDPFWLIFFNGVETTNQMS